MKSLGSVKMEEGGSCRKVQTRMRGAQRREAEVVIDRRAGLTRTIVGRQYSAMAIGMGRRLA